MRVIYCKKCNHFSYQSITGNYCKKCKCPVIPVDITTEEFFNMPINERYRLAYKLTKEEEK